MNWSCSRRPRCEPRWPSGKVSTTGPADPGSIPGVGAGIAQSVVC